MDVPSAIPAPELQSAGAKASLDRAASTPADNPPVSKARTAFGSGGILPMTKWEQQLHTLYGPSWRRMAAQRRARGARLECRDLVVRAAAEYYRHVGDPSRLKVLQRRKPHLCAAIEIEQEPDFARWARLLVAGNVPRKEIARLLQVSSRALFMWESIFWDLRGMRRSPDWINVHCVGYAQRNGDGELARRLRTVFSSGKPGVARKMWDAAKRGAPKRTPLEVARDFLQSLCVPRARAPGSGATQNQAAFRRLLRDVDQELARQKKDRAVDRPEEKNMRAFIIGYGKLKDQAKAELDASMAGSSPDGQSKLNRESGFGTSAGDKAGLSPEPGVAPPQQASSSAEANQR